MYTTTVYTDLSEIPWKDMLENTTNLTMWFKSSNTWLEQNSSKLMQLVERGGKITVILPDAYNPHIMNDVMKYNSDQYSGGKKPEDGIKETIDRLKEFAVTDDSVSIYLYPGMINFPAYVFDEAYLLGYHEHGKTNAITSPCTLYKSDEFIQNQMEILQKKSYFLAIDRKN